jgi:zinc protease
VTQDDLKAFHQFPRTGHDEHAHRRRRRDAGEVLPLLEIHFGKWQRRRLRVAREPAPALPKPPRQLLLVDMPNAPQSRIFIGGVGASSATSDFFPIQVLNTVLRGRFSSGRNPTLRDHTAGVRLGLRPAQIRGPVRRRRGGADRQDSRRAPRTAQRADQRAEGHTGGRTGAGEGGDRGAVPEDVRGGGRISNRLRAMESLLSYGLPDDYYAKYVPAIQAVGAADVQRVAQQYIQPDQLTIAIVGARKTIEQASPRAEPPTDQGREPRRGSCAGQVAAELPAVCSRPPGTT